jgi:uncharacterized protein YoxC
MVCTGIVNIFIYGFRTDNVTKWHNTIANMIEGKNMKLDRAVPAAKKQQLQQLQQQQKQQKQQPPPPINFINLTDRLNSKQMTLQQPFQTLSDINSSSSSSSSFSSPIVPHSTIEISAVIVPDILPEVL